MSHVLVLNKNFYAIAVTGWQRAMGLLWTDHAMAVDDTWQTYNFENWLEWSSEVTEHAPGFVSTPSIKIAIPQAIKLRIFGKIPQREITFSRRNVYLHYDFKCSYCDRQFPPDGLNLDHILPRSRGGATDWSNIVPSYIPCNKRKADRLPEEAGMKLLVRPQRPRPHGGAFMWKRFPEALRDGWKKFLL